MAFQSFLQGCGLLPKAKYGGGSGMLSDLFDFLNYLAQPENYHCTEVELGAGNDYLLFTRISHLMEERDGRVSRSELETMLNYSGDYLNRIVKKYSGMPLFDFGMTFCLKKPEYYLENSGDSVAEIAARCGFTNKTHFYKWFRKLFGTTPTAYRHGVAARQTEPTAYLTGAASGKSEPTAYLTDTASGQAEL